MNAPNPMEHATDAQRIEAIEATAGTLLIARFVRRAEPGLLIDGPAAARLNAVGDPIRCQVGEVFAQSGSFEQPDGNGGKEKIAWSSNDGFRLLGYGATFTEAVQMAKGVK